MKYTKHIDSSIILLNIMNDYDFTSTSYQGKVSNWIYRSIRELIAPNLLIVQNKKFKTSNGRALIPNNVEVVYHVIVDGKPAVPCSDFLLPITEDMNHADIYTPSGNIFIDTTNLVHYERPVNKEVKEIDYSSMRDPMTTQTMKEWVAANRKDCATKYRISNNWIFVEDADAVIEMKIGTYPSVYNQDFNQLFPIIPDNQNLIELLTQYCLQRILMSGVVHPILSLEKNNKFVNPAMYYEDMKPSVISELNAIDRNTSEMLSDILNIAVI